MNARRGQYGPYGADGGMSPGGAAARQLLRAVARWQAGPAAGEPPAQTAAPPLLLSPALAPRPAPRLPAAPLPAAAAPLPPPLPATAAGVLVLAIDGHGGAGKSTIAAAVAAAAGAALVHTDDFFHQPRRGGGLTGYYDLARLREQAIEPLAAGRAATFRRFDWASGGGLLPAPVTTGPAALVIVEGVLAAAPALADVVGRSVLVDTPEPERLRRLRARIAPPDWDTDWLAAEQAYFRDVRPPSSFDLVLPGGRPAGQPARALPPAASAPPRRGTTGSTRTSSSPG